MSTVPLAEPETVNTQHHTHEKGHHHHEDRSDHPRRRHRFISVATALFTLVTFILFLLVALSLPIIKNIWLLSIHAKISSSLPVTSIATELKFGVWGFCAFSKIGTSFCYGPRLGYSLSKPINIAALIGQPKTVDAITHALTVVLILHPVVAGLAFAVLLTSLLLRSHGISILALVFAIITSLAGSVVLAIDLALVVIARNKVPDATDDQFSVGWGNGVWMVLAAVVCSWISVIVLSVRACVCCGVRRKY